MARQVSPTRNRWLVPRKSRTKIHSNCNARGRNRPLYEKRKSSYEIASQLGISDSTVRRILKEQGISLRSPFDNHQPLPLTDDNSELQQPSPQVIEPQVIDATSIPYAPPLDRACTVFGLIEEAPVEFQSADGVSYAGALLGLALLEETHLLEEARAVYGRLKNGWYGLRSLVWTLVLMASGMRFRYDPSRPKFDVVTAIELGDLDRGYKSIDITGKDTRLYSLSTPLYLAMILVAIPKYTKGKLPLVAKKKDGQPLNSKVEALNDPRSNTPDLLAPAGSLDRNSVATSTGSGGRREIKEWQAIMDHLRRLPVTKPGDLPVIPVDERAAEVRAIKVT